jgi:hypothetical protein
MESLHWCRYLLRIENDVNARARRAPVPESPAGSVYLTNVDPRLQPALYQTAVKDVATALVTKVGFVSPEI